MGRAIRSYVTDRLGGVSDLRWSRCAAADIHRLLMSGGIYISAANQVLRDSGHRGVLRQLYEVNPLAFVVEQAGGLASDGRQRVLDVPCNELHQRSSAVMGSAEHVEHFLEKYQQ
jgi:fructose-1,6-bisphosphatase I